MHEGFERDDRHLRPEVAAADADVDDVADAAGGGIAHAFGVGEHLVEDAVHFVGKRPGAARCAQGGVQHCAAFGGVDRLAGEHRVAVLLHAALARQVVQEAQRRRVEQILRQVGVNLGRAPGQALHTLGIAREGFAQIEAAAVGFEVAVEGGPRHGGVATFHASAPIILSSLTASAAKARMPSASLSWAIASSFSAQRKLVSL